MSMDSSSSNTGGTANGSGDASAADTSEVSGATASAEGPHGSADSGSGVADTTESEQLTTEGKLHVIGSADHVPHADDTPSAAEAVETDGDVRAEETTDPPSDDATDAGETKAGTDDVAEPEPPTNEGKLQAIGPDSATGTDDGSDVVGAETRTGTEEVDDSTGESDDSVDDATADREWMSDGVRNRLGAVAVKATAWLGAVGSIFGVGVAQDDAKVSQVGADNTPSFRAPADAKAGATPLDRFLARLGQAGDAMKGGARGTRPAPSDVPPEPTGFPTKQQEKGVNQKQRPEDDETPGP